MPRLGTPTGTIEVLHKYNFNFQKKFGQNFLIEPGVLETIVEAAEIGEEDCVLEIGPGIGTMTQYLAEQAGEVIAVEIDKALIPILKDTLSAYTNVTVINADILKLDVEELVREKNGGKPVKVVANLPYYITTPIIMQLFESHVPLESITIMVQTEVAERGCRWGREPRITAPFPSRYSITPGRKLSPMSRRPASCPNPMWEAPSFVLTDMKSPRWKRRMKNLCSD